MYDSLCRFYEKNRWLVLYGLFGIGTIVVNMFVYGVCAMYLNMSTFVSNVFAWIISVLFSYIVNHTWVFDNVSHDVSGVIRECISFVGCRVMTGILDVLLMVFLVDFMIIHDMSAKILVNIVVIIVNLFACKHIVFRTTEISDNIEELEL